MDGIGPKVLGTHLVLEFVMIDVMLDSTVAFHVSLRTLLSTSRTVGHISTI